MPTKLLAAYDKASRIPVVGRGAFSLAFAVRVPYFLTIAPTILEMRPNHAEVKVRKWWGTHNHLGTLHVIAVANGLEMAMGALAEATIPSHLRWIPMGMELRYPAKATSSLIAIAETDPDDWADPGEVPVRVHAVRRDGTTVVEGVLRLHTSLRK